MQLKREGKREREKEKERESGHRMTLGEAPQLFPGALPAIYLQTASSACGPFRMNSKRQEEVKCQESEVKNEKT